MQGHAPDDGFLLGDEFLPEAQVGLLGNILVQPVQVDQVQPLLDLGLALLEAGEHPVVVVLFVPVTLPQGRDQELKYLLVELDGFQRSGECLVEGFLPDERLGTFTAVAGAVIVDILPLLFLSDHRAAAVTALHESLEGPSVLAHPLESTTVMVQQFLDLVEEFPADDGLVRPVVSGPTPHEIAVIDGIRQDVLNHALRELATSGSVGKPLRYDLLCQVPQRGVPVGVPLEDFQHERDHRRVWLDEPLVAAFDVQVSHRGERGVDPLLCLLPHPLAGLLGEVVDVVLRHQDLDTVDELLVGPAVAAQDLVFLDEVDLPVEFVNGHVVSEIPVKTVGLLDKKVPDGWRFLEKGDHPIKVCPSGLFGSLNIREFL